MHTNRSGSAAAAAAQVALAALLLSVALAGCGGGAAGDSCRVNSDCDPGLYCDPLTTSCQGAGTDAGDLPGVDSGPPPPDSGVEPDAGFNCGNGVCGAAETCASCPDDCGGPCADPCGDGLCAGAPDEDCVSCASDCGSCCGNGTCDDGMGESCGNCAVDCGACVTCDDGVCDTALGETCSNCVLDCGSCCGNALCEPSLGEDCNNCTDDCGDCCPNGTCETTLGEDCNTCTADCGGCPVTCPNGLCGGTETCATCPGDCGSCCGNLLCEPGLGETCGSCSADCGLCPGTCGDGIIDPGESCEPPSTATCDATCQVISGCAMDVGTLGCGSVVMGNNGDPGSTDANDSWSGCPGFTGESGPEVAYTFVSATDQNVTFNLTMLGADLDMGLLTGMPECDPSTCVDFSWSGGLTPENVGPVLALAGQPLYVIVEGWAGNVGDFTLSASCAPPPPPPPTGTGTCADPLVIDGSSSFTLVDGRTLCGAGNDSMAPSTDDCTGAGNGGDLVYRLDLAFAADVTLDLWDADGSAFVDTVMYVRDMCSPLGPTTGIACNDDTGGQPRHAHLDLALAAGSYYIWTDQTDVTDALGTMWTCGYTELTITVF